MSRAPSFLLSSSHRLSTLGRKQRPLATVHLLAHSCTSISILKDMCNLKYCSYVGTLADAASSKGSGRCSELLSIKILLELCYKGRQCCYLGQVTTSGMRILIKSFTCRSGAHHSACSYLPDMMDSQYIWRNYRQVLKQSVRLSACAEVLPWRCLREVAISTNIQLPVKK